MAYDVALRKSWVAELAAALSVATSNAPDSDSTLVTVDVCQMRRKDPAITAAARASAKVTADQSRPTHQSTRTCSMQTGCRTQLTTVKMAPLGLNNT